MPIQIKRLIVAFTIFISLMLLAKYFLTPESWREYGPYRGNALIEIADQTPKYVDIETCITCHDSISEYKNQSNHLSLQCEICHGVGYLHADDPEQNHMEILDKQSLCLRCHMKNPARPANVIKQIDPAEHGEGEECINCHNPHQT